MPRFIYHAYATALGGRIRRPLVHYIDAQAACVLPSTGGRVAASAPAYSLTDPASGEFILSFESAQTSIEGGQTRNGFRATTLTCTVKNINIANVLRAAEVVSRLHLTYNTANHSVMIDTSGSWFGNLTIDGQVFNVSVDHALGMEAADYHGFRQAHPEYPETRGAIRHALGRHPALVFDPFDNGYLHRPNFGRIYFCEWTAAPYTQTLTMLRLRLGSPQEGDLEIGVCGGNGQDYP